MVTISHVVQDILNKHVFLQEAINHGIVSYNKLADNIKPEIEAELGKKVKHNAVVMALRRYTEKIEKKQKAPTFSYFKETLLKTDVCYIAVEESATALNKIQEIYNKMELRHGKIFNIVHGNYEIGIITNQSNKERVLDSLSDERVLRVVEDLVVISLLYSKDYLFTPGTIYNVLRFIAWENINILSIILTTQELNLLISREDTMKCYNSLERLVQTTKAEDEKH